MGKFNRPASDFNIIYSLDLIASSDISAKIPTVFFKFDSLPLVDYVSNNKITISNDSRDQLFLTEGAFGNALNMRPLSVLSFGLDKIRTDLKEFSLGFWLKPFNIKPTSNPTTGLSNYYRLALVDKANFILDGASGNINAIADESTFVVYEECKENSMNLMKLVLQSGASEEVVIVTPEYAANEFHYFWITYSGTAGDVRIFIDGIDQGIFLEEGSDIPTVLNVDPSVPLHINNSAIGNSGLLRGNFGVLDELIFRAEYQNDPVVLSGHINKGSEYIINNALANLMEVHQGIAYDDPTTIDVSAVFGNGKNIYAGRSDGRLFRGDRTMWKARRDFANRDEINSVNKNLLSPDSIIDIVDGSLRLFKGTAKI